MMGKIGLRTKIAVTLVAVIALLGSVAIFQAQYDLRRILRRELRGRGLAVAGDIASRSADPVLTNDLFAIYQMINDTLVNNYDVRYVMLLDPAGEALVHTFGEGIPKGLRQANLLPPGATERVKPLATEEGIIQDIAVPIHGGSGGTVRVGMSEASLNAAVGNLVRKLLILIGLAILVGVGASYALATLLTRPIFHLVQAAKAVARGDLAWRTPVRGRDEIGQLGTAFNAMTEELAKSREELIARNREMSLLYEELQVKDGLRGQLLDRAIHAQEEERKRVARELHDGLAQNLAAVIMTLKALEEVLPDGVTAVSQRLERCKRLATASVGGIREMIMALRPSVLDELGLAPAIRWYAENHLESRGITVQLKVTDLKERWPAEIEIAVFRIVQEAINNVAKHAQAKTVSISLATEDSRVVGTVTDDGKGFAVNQVLGIDKGAHALGLLGIQERLSLLGGHLDIRSKPGEGTCITFQVPVHSGDNSRWLV